MSFLRKFRHSRYSSLTFFVIFFHQRNLKKAIKIDSVDSSSGVLLPYYDHDTRIVFLAGKVVVKVIVMCICMKNSSGCSGHEFFAPNHHYAYSPFYFLYICYGIEKENLFADQELFYFMITSFI